tara:strand:+ start:1996 stop:2322 length:327 start_codon:yes stop_codon:yes gene_type:complete
MNIVEKFSNYLTDIQYPKQKTSWNIAGTLKGKNSFFKYDVREMQQLSSGEWAKTGDTSTKAEKMVFEAEKDWLIIDIEELHNYLKITKQRIVYLEELKNLDWNMVIKK